MSLAGGLYGAGTHQHTSKPRFVTNFLCDPGREQKARMAWVNTAPLMLMPCHWTVNFALGSWRLWSNPMCFRVIASDQHCTVLAGNFEDAACSVGALYVSVQGGYLKLE